MTSKANLAKFLSSVVYRVTVHGITRLNNTINPVISFIPNFPPCLQSSTLPAADQPLDTEALLKLLPWTATIGDQVNFYFIFVFSKPFDNLIPPGGAASNLPFPGGLTDKRNQAIVEFRNRMTAFILQYEPANPQLNQWPLSIDT